jgi:hypothetical protein
MLPALYLLTLMKKINPLMIKTNSIKVLYIFIYNSYISNIINRRVGGLISVFVCSIEFSYFYFHFSENKYLTKS